MSLSTLRTSTILLAIASLTGCLGAVDGDVEQGSAGLERGRIAERKPIDRDGDVDRLERCTRDWECRPGDTCLAPDGEDRDVRPDLQVCGREPDFACESDRECGAGAECLRDGNCVRLRDHKDECTARYRRIANRIRSAVEDGTMRPATARALWQRLTNAVRAECGDAVRDDGVRDDGARDDGADDGSRDDGSRDGSR